MDKLGRKRGLIRYTSQDELAGKPRKLLRVRTIVYPALLAVAGGLLMWGVAERASAQVWVDRVSGPSFVEVSPEIVSSQSQLAIENQTDEPRVYALSVVDAPDVTLRTQAQWNVAARKQMVVPVFVDVPRKTFVHGTRTIHIRIDDSSGFESIVAVTLLGPELEGGR